MTQAPLRERRSLSHVGGEVLLRGDPKLAPLLARALDVASDESETRAHVHGFHTYPARMHPATAARLVRELCPPGGTVLDPFCGSGTVLVEARLAGRSAIGVDLNPLAVAIARRKVTPMPAAERAALVAGARRAAGTATERRKARAGASRRYPASDTAAFDPHVLLELDGLRVGIQALGSERLSSDLMLVLSSILVKLSRRTSDTAPGPRPTRIAAGYAARLFVKKTEELARALAEVEAPLAAGPEARVLVGDARALRGVRPESVDLVVSSPPYAAVYDYVEHHRMRLRWLGFDARELDRAELGSRRELTTLSTGAARDAYVRDLALAIRAAARAMKPGASCVLLVADSAVGRAAIRGDESVAAAATDAELVRVAAASQARPHFHTPTTPAFHGAERMEHALLLQKPRPLRDNSVTTPTSPRQSKKYSRRGREHS